MESVADPSDARRSATSLRRISVLIPAYNEAALIARTIASVHESFEGVGWRNYEIIVCDNNSTDDTSRIAEANGARVVFEAHNQIARARNAAASAATGDWLIFLDADTQLNPALLAATVECLEAGRVCGGGSVLRFERANIGAMASALTRFWNAVSAGLHLAAGSYLFCLREAWKETGGFDVRIYAGEELYFSRKVKAWGKRRGLRFRVLTSAPIVTSARKMDWYGPWELLRHMLRLAIPGAIKRQEACDLWYKRPESR